MTSKPRSRSAQVIAQVFLLGCSLLFAFAVHNQVQWLLALSAVVLWGIVVVGYANILIWMFKDGLVALAEKSNARNLGWMPFVSGTVTITMLLKQGWVALSIFYVVLLFWGFLLRMVAREKVHAVDKPR